MRTRCYEGVESNWVQQPELDSNEDVVVRDEI
jgi:hypothetical protein